MTEHGLLRLRELEETNKRLLKLEDRSTSSSMTSSASGKSTCREICESFIKYAFRSNRQFCRQA